jgi:hypothetical protein
MIRGTVVLASLAVAITPAWAQDDIAARLTARGAAPALVERVRALVAGAQEEGLPAWPIENKALEGIAKHAPADRIAPVLEQVRNRLRQGLSVTQAAGLVPPPGEVVAAAAEALGRGMTAEDVRGLIRGAPAPEAAAAGLTVAASLAAQGLERRAAVRAVHDAYGRGPGPQQLFELPSVVADLTARGSSMADVARRILEGGGLPLPPMAGEGAGKGGRPGALPPGPGQSGQHGQGRGRNNR